MTLSMESGLRLRFRTAKTWDADINILHPKHLSERIS
jgi:hypothetical protein